MTEGPVALAQIGSAHGLKGEVRVRFFSDDPAAACARGPFFTSPDPNARQLECASYRPGKTMDVVRFKGIDTREGAEALSGLFLYQPRALFAPPAEDEYYHADLIGLSVLRASDRAPCGSVIDVFRNGANDVLAIRMSAGGQKKTTIYLPFTHAALPEVNIEKGIIVAEDSWLEEGASPT
jgi:16S rRNA processing protein RimM